MITYELVLLLRTVPKNEIKEILRRTSDQIFKSDGFIRKLENLGTRETPHKMKAHGLIHRKASYFLFEFNAPASSIVNLLDEFERDVDIVRRRIFKKTEQNDREENPYSCTLDEEIKPPPYRKNVQELIQQAKKFEKPKFKYNSDLGYYPFGK